MGCGASAERYAPGERSEAVQGDQRVASRAQGEVEQPKVEPVESLQQDKPPAGAERTRKPQPDEAEPSAVKSDEVEESSAVKPEAAVAGEHRQSAQPTARDASPAEWQRPETWPARKEVPTPSPDAMHVVLSTKFVEPWGTISRGFKEILEEKGCTVYNPNTATWTVN